MKLKNMNFGYDYHILSINQMNTQSISTLNKIIFSTI